DAVVVGHPDRGDVEHRLDPRRRDLDHVAVERREGRGAGGAGVDGGGHAAVEAVGIGLDAERGDAPVDVGMQVDPAGRDEQAGGVDDLAADAAPGDVGADRGDPRSYDAHVGDGVEVLRRVEHAPAAHQDVEHGGYLLMGDGCWV